MKREEAWDKIQSLCPGIEPSDDLAWPHKTKNGIRWILSNKTVQRIAAHHKIIVTYGEPKELMGNIYIRATARNTVTGLEIETFGESNSKNTVARYPIAIAEKRAHDRAVLKSTEVYVDFYSESEADDFRKPKTKEE